MFYNNRDIKVQNCNICFSFSSSFYRSSNYNPETGSCELSDMDRLTLAGSTAFQADESSEYLENNCAEEPTKLCEFKRLSGRILKTVDSVYQDVSNVDECRELCLSSPYRLVSFVCVFITHKFFMIILVKGKPKKTRF